MNNEARVKIRNSPTNKELIVKSTNRPSYTLAVQKEIILKFGTHELEVDGYELTKAIDNCLNIQ